MKFNWLSAAVLSAVFFTTWGTPAWAQSETPAEEAPAKEAGSAAAGGTLDRSMPVVFVTAAPYYNEDGVASNIVDECTQLGTQLSEATAMYLAKQGVQADRQASVDVKKAKQALNITIVSAFSAGNAFMGHHKSVSVRAEFYKNGVLIAKTGKTRDSRGGAFAGFKSSCSVLERTVTTLGSDIAKWLVTVH